jgi:hypothetical protein
VIALFITEITSEEACVPDPVNNDTGNLGDGHSPSQTPTNSPAAGGTSQSTQYGSAKSPATAQGNNAGNSPNTPLHSDGGNLQTTGTGPETDAGGARIPGINASGMPDWTETLEAINAIPERIVNALREAELTRANANQPRQSAPLPGHDEPQNTDAPNTAGSATGPSAPQTGDTKVHWWFRTR